MLNWRRSQSVRSFTSGIRPPAHPISVIFLLVPPPILPLGRRQSTTAILQLLPRLDGAEQREKSKMNQKLGWAKAPTGMPSLAWSCIASLLVGASIVHSIYKPDLTLPDMEDVKKLKDLLQEKD